MQRIVRKTLGTDADGQKVYAEIWLLGKGKAEYVETSDSCVYQRNILTKDAYLQKINELLACP